MPTALTKENYKKKALESEKPVIVEFFSELCGTCQQMKPIFEELEKEHSEINFFTIDIEKEEDLVSKLGIKSVPTFFFIKEGEIKGKEHGYIAKEDFVEKINNYIG